MNLSYNRWKKLFLFCLGIAIASAFCMKWMESDFYVHNEKFTIVGLELFYPKEKIEALLASLSVHVKTILTYHLSFDFIFMAGVYPGTTALCMMAKEKIRVSSWGKFLHILATLQLLAWGCDIAENLYLLKWLKEPMIGWLEPPVIGNEFYFYHFVVFAKWIIVLTGILTAVTILVLKRKRNSQPLRQ